MDLTQIIGGIGFYVEAFGVLVIVVGILHALVKYGARYLRDSGDDLYVGFRSHIGRALMLGLEFLVAGDIIRTVVINPSIEDVAALGLLVLIRTVLVFTIHLEVEGRWPWNPGSKT